MPLPGRRSFDADGTITEYYWDFGDGTSAFGPTAEHTYILPGTYRATLVVTDNAGEQSFVNAPMMVVVPGGAETAVNLGGDANLTNQLHVTGGNYVSAGDLACNSDVQISGSVFVAGNVHLTNNCRIAGDLFVGGTLTMDSTPEVLGSVEAAGDIRFQSTARIGGSVATSGTFTVTDGLSHEALADKGSVGGTISEGVPMAKPSIAPYQPYTVGELPDEAITWKQWMNQTAQANRAPSWSQGLSSTPGCTMAPWASSVNGSTVTTTGDLFIDARQPASGCSAVALQQMTLSLGGDLTLVVDRFDAISGLRVATADGNPYTLTIKVEGTAGANANLTFSAVTTVDPEIKVALQTPGKVTINGTSTLNASIVSGGLATSGAVLLG